MDQDLRLLSSQIGRILTQNELSIAAAESCTGGLFAHTLTSVPGSSKYFVGGVVAYSNRIKETILGVQTRTLLNYGAVSFQTAEEMALGIREKFDASIGLSTTGIAGPSGGTPEKPVGLVWLGISTSQRTQTFECHFEGDREQVQTSSVRKLLWLLLDYLEEIAS